MVYTKSKKSKYSPGSRARWKAYMSCRPRKGFGHTKNSMMIIDVAHQTMQKEPLDPHVCINLFMKNLHMKMFFCLWVRHNLKEHQKLDCVSINKESLNLISHDGYYIIPKIITDD